MKIFRSESFVDYKTYTFNYATYCIKEKKSELPEIYDKGFLPYSNNTDLKVETYYLARSLRIELSDYKETSENRRVDRKIQEINPSFEVIPVKDFNLKDPVFLSYCFDFANKRFSEPISMNRLEYIFSAKSVSHVFRFRADGKPVGYVIAIIENDTLHYWFAFFDLDNPKYSLGKWMMFSVIRWAFENDLSYVYLGTCYGEKSLYKVRDFKGLSYFDGNQWVKNVKSLKLKCRADGNFVVDTFKQDTDLFLENLNV
ncbi:GNAT family N-acetyltransferase [Lutimonas saemankumensis]|uniref:GNAT family N-acetyltransferase n=1 Tax=Lutimonas saemankumensis TaxID=483016 RepID=UPI001CD4A503|nr:GNAT family N-acetyltransferase [Lutimonas saemankumensis]MCA0932273.1 GNAT family N-acetyltransferase [Lutimonas saemankumensis]